MAWSNTNACDLEELYLGEVVLKRFKFTEKCSDCDSNRQFLKKGQKIASVYHQLLQTSEAVRKLKRLD